MVVSEIRPMLSPKQAPPAIAQVVKSRLPLSTQLGSTICTSQRKIGEQAAKVPQEVPVATDNIAVAIRPVTAVVLAVTPKDRAMLTTEAPTPVFINAPVSYTHLDVYKRQVPALTLVSTTYTK